MIKELFKGQQRAFWVLQIGGWLAWGLIGKYAYTRVIFEETAPGYLKYVMIITAVALVQAWRTSPKLAGFVDANRLSAVKHQLNQPRVGTGGDDEVVLQLSLVAVVAQVDAVFLDHPPRRGVGTYIEADQDGVRGHGQVGVGFGDSADARRHQADRHRWVTSAPRAVPKDSIRRPVRYQPDQRPSL